MRNSLKQFIFLVVVVCVQLKCSAQTIDIKWSEINNDIELGKFIGIINDEYIFSNRIYATNKSFVTKFNTADLKTAKQFTVQETDDSFKNYRNIFSIVSGNKILHGISIENKKEKTELFQLVEWNESGNFLEKTNKELAFKYDKWSSIEYALSTDKSKLIIYKSFFSSKTFSSDYEYVVIDVTTANSIDTGKFSIDNKTEKVNKLLLDNFGQVHVILEKYKSKGEQKKDEMKFDYIIRVFSNSNLKKEIKVEIPNYQVLTYDYLQGVDNLFYITGFAYSLPDDRKEKFTNKIYLSTIDCMTLEVSNFKVQELSTLYPNRKLVGDEGVPYTIKSVNKLKDGSYSIIGEQIFSSYNGSTGATSYSHYGIACIKLTKDFKIEYITVIPKIQIDVNYFSFISTYINDKVYFLYNDHIENTNKYDKNELKWMSNTNSKTGFFLATVAQDGSYKKEMIFDYNNEKEKVNTVLSQVITPNEILLNHVNKIGILNLK